MAGTHATLPFLKIDMQHKGPPPPSRAPDLGGRGGGSGVTDKRIMQVLIMTHLSFYRALV